MAVVKITSTKSEKQNVYSIFKILTQIVEIVSFFWWNSAKSMPLNITAIEVLRTAFFLENYSKNDLESFSKLLIEFYLKKLKNEFLVNILLGLGFFGTLWIINIKIIYLCAMCIVHIIYLLFLKNNKVLLFRLYSYCIFKFHCKSIK